MKHALVYTTMFICLLTAILLPTDWFWWGVLRGICIAIFIHLIPVWVQVYKETYE